MDPIAHGRRLGRRLSYTIDYRLHANVCSRDITSGHAFEGHWVLGPDESTAEDVQMIASEYLLNGPLSKF
jgi:hypothetical protein